MYVTTFLEGSLHLMWSNFFSYQWVSVHSKLFFANLSMGRLQSISASTENFLKEHCKSFRQLASFSCFWRTTRSASSCFWRTASSPSSCLLPAVSSACSLAKAAKHLPPRQHGCATLNYNRLRPDSV